MSGGEKRRYAADERGRKAARRRAMPHRAGIPAHDDAAARAAQHRAIAYGRARGRL